MSTRRRKLLLADDSPTIQKIVSLTLSDEGFEVVTASGGEEALRLLSGQTPPDIVLADVAMPGPDGYELCERIKSDARLNHVPVVLLAGTFEPFNQAEARRVGADEVLTKPFQSIRELVNRVGSLLGGGEAEGAEKTPARASEDDAATEEFSSSESAERPAHLSEPTVTARASAEEGEGAPATSHADAEAPEIPFADIAADDQMIEAKPAEEFMDEPRVAETAPRPEEEVSAWHETNESPAAVAAAAGGGSASEASHVVAQTPPETPSYAATGAPGAPTFDDFLLDLDVASGPRPAAAAATEDSILDLDDELPAPEAANAQEVSARAAVGSTTFVPGVDPQGSLAKAAHGERTPAGGAESFALGAEGFAPGFDADETPTLVGASQLSPPTPAEADDAARQTSQGLAASGESRGAGQQITLEQLSPEVIDAVARRAVELLSDRAVREIAWDVVPQLAELLIRQRLDEQR